MSDLDPALNTLLHDLLTGAQSVLAEHFVGLYLYGSLASGDFDEHTSDVDFVIVTDEEIAGALFPALAALHTRLGASANKWAHKLEGTYISRTALRRYNPADPPRPCLNEGQFYLAAHGADWVIQRHILREHGVAIAGPPIQPLIDPVTPDELRQAVAGILEDWWRPMLTTPARLSSPDYQAYAVLTMCRALHALQHGVILSKPAAARWALTALEPRWHNLIHRALDWRPGQPLDILDEALALVAHTLNQNLKGLEDL